ncbi:MAG TPA: CrcB family protein [Pseudolysinimonas sp.]|nr:CrcB family protein [Pseudolysinimonas sp.]
MTLVAVVLGGILGTGLRLTIDQLVAPESAFPWATLLVNLVGSLVLGFLVAKVWPSAPAWLRAGLGTGLLGSFTTFSAVIVALLTLTSAGMTLLAIVYLVVTLLLGWAAALLGIRLGVRAPADPPIGADE